MTPLFTLILLHYRQEAFYREALASVFSQSYPAIELIFADDATPRLDTEAVKAYIESHKPANITSVQYFFNPENIGTVRTLKNAIAAAQGKYVLFFAADDKLARSNSIARIVEEFEALPEDHKVLATQTDMMDFSLDKRTWFRPLPEQKNRLSMLTDPHQLFEMTCVNCVFGISSMAFRTSLFSEYAYLDETKNKVIEDWPIILRLSRRGEPVTYADFTTMLHRDGGISNSLSRGTSPLQIVFENEHLDIIEQDILPYLDDLPMREQVMVYHFYRDALQRYRAKFGRRSGTGLGAVYAAHPRLAFRLFKNWIVEKHWKLYVAAKDGMKASGWLALTSVLGAVLFGRHWAVQALQLFAFAGFSASFLLYIAEYLLALRFKSK